MYNIHVTVQKCNIDDSDGDTLLIKEHLQTGFVLIFCDFIRSRYMQSNCTRSGGSI